MINLYLALFMCSFIFVAVKAFQQLNVTLGYPKLVIPTSLAMAGCEVFLVWQIASAGWSVPVWLSTGLGGGLGCLLSMRLHKRYIRKQKVTANEGTL